MRELDFVTEKNRNNTAYYKIFIKSRTNIEPKSSIVDKCWSMLLITYNKSIQVSDGI